MRNVEKAITEGTRILAVGGFDVSLGELYEIFRISEEESEGDTTTKVVNAIRFGAAIGSRAEKKRIKKAARAEKVKE